MVSNKVLLSGITEIAGREVLFQSAVYWAEEGSKVIYITPSKFEKLPSTGHGPQIPSPEILAKIRIVYAETAEQLLQFATDILKFCDTTPKVILVDGLDKVAAVGDSRDSDHIMAQMCATLAHVVSCCSLHSNQLVHLLVTVSKSMDKLPPATCSMFNSLWCFESSTFTLTRKFPFNSSPTVVVTLANRADGAIVLKQLDHFFVTTAK